MITTDDSGVSDTDNITRISTPTFAGTAEANSTIKLFANNVLVGTGTTGANGNYTVSVSQAIADGTYAFTATATVSGLESSSTSPLSVVIDTTPPTFTGTRTVSALKGEAFTSVVASFTDNHPNGAATIAWGDGRTSTGTIVANNSGAYNIVGTNTYEQEGNFSITVTLIDAAGNSSVANTSATVSTPPPTIQFSQGSQSLSEGAGSFNLTVNRTGNVNAAVTVNYASSDTAGLQNCDVANGIASQRCDYAASVGTLRFASGETSKSIPVSLVDDVYVEGAESFSITLSDPTGGALLGATRSVNITINDNGNDSSGATNPIDVTSFFVRQHYLDFLNREPEPGGYNAWIHRLDFCGQPGEPPPCDHVEVSSAFFRSPEFRERGYFVYKFYAASLGRSPAFPHYAEFIPDLAKVSGFQTPQELEANKAAFAQEFVVRAEFQNRYQGTNNQTYVDLLLQTAGVTSPQRNGWIAALDAGTKTRAEVLRELVESPEVDAKYYTESFVVMQYFGYLRRDPDALYLNWIQTMNADPNNYRQMVSGFMNSAEYRKRFGP